MTTFAEPVCSRCKHYNSTDNSKWSCKAFPRGIPDKIWEQGTHDEPIKGQRNSIVFESIIMPPKR